MTARSSRHLPSTHRVRLAVAALLAVGLAPAVVVAGAPSATAATAAPAVPAVPAAPSGPQFHDDGSALTLTVAPGAGSPGYTVAVAKSPFRITTQRAGNTVLQTTAGAAGSSGPADFRTADGWATATAVQDANWHDGVLDLVLATDAPGDTVSYRIAPQPDRYRITWSVHGGAAANQVASHYVLASAGHWYGQGEAQTPDGGPGTRQPWPLDSGTVRDTAMGPAEYLMTDPFWFTQRGTGLWVDTHDVMDVSLNAAQPGVFGYTLTGSDAMDSTVFVEATPRDVYADYIGITGTPAKSDATPAQYAKPLWNSWAQYYTTVSQASTLSWAKGLHDAGLPAQAIQVDDGWMSHYGDFTFNSKFPDPKQLSDQIHAMGDDFGLWVTLWINTDADNYSYAAQHGYLLKSKNDPSKPCDVTWWNGTAGIVDLANPDARAWYVGQLQNLEKTYGVDGFKFDTRFFDESCAPYPRHTALDYLTLGAQLTDHFDQQGAGVRISWTGSQKYGFVTRQVDKGTGWDSLQAAVAQNLSISTIGYPFVETDMIGGSGGQPPPAKDVLARWAQAASLMPLMYSSTSPLGVSNPYGSRRYDQQTTDLYRAAAKAHGRLASYIDKQVTRAVQTGEPIMKPLFFDYPGDHATYTIDDEWLLGDSLLAAPMLTDRTSRDVHVPAGRWYDVVHHRVVSGPTTLTGYSADLTQTPAFIRLGTPDTGALMSALAPNAPKACVASGSFDTRPAADALRRLIGDRAGQLTLRAAEPSAQGDYFQVCAQGNHPVIAGTSNATLLTGANWYLKNVVHAGITWEGDAVANLPDRLPAPSRPIYQSSPFRHRFAGNDTMSGYTGPYWTWDRWQREIDVLAANGVNEVLDYPGQALAYYDTFRRYGYSDADLRGWIPQPGHQPWWLLENMSTFDEPISMNLLQQQAALGRKIADRLRELDMTPVFPGYYGTVPPDFAARNPGAYTVPQGSWGGFTRPDWLDPRDSHFAPIASAFYADQQRLFGTSSMYKMDLLHEGGNAGDVPVGDAAHAVQAALETAHPGATWVILGWQSNPQPELLAGVDKSKMLVVDGLSDRYTGLDREQQWSGTPYAYGSIWNFGGHTTIGANLTTWAKEFPQWANKSGSALSGIALMPEGNDNNPAAFAFFTELAWHPDGVDPKAWMANYATWRYGGQDDHAQAAWQTLLDTAYSLPSGSWSEAQDGLFEAQPSLAATSAASWSPGSMRYDAAAFARALPDLLAVAPSLRDTSAYRYDLVDVARQVLANESRVLLPQIASAYEAKDEARFAQLSTHWLDLMKLMDKLLATDSHFLLGPWLRDARSAAADPAEATRLEYDARTLLTEWGTRSSSVDNGLHDYANREWSGLVGDFYYGRWEKYFAGLDSALKSGTAPAPIDWYAVDDAWARSGNSYPTSPSGDSYSVANEVWQTVSRDPIFGQVGADASPKAVNAGDASTVTVTFINANPVNAAQQLSLGLTAPDGFTVAPTSSTTFAPVPPGGTARATFTVTVPSSYRASSAIDQIDLPADATFSYAGGSAGTATGLTSLLVARPVAAPNRTVAFAPAVFGQSGDSYAIYAGGNDLWGGTNQFGTIYRGGGLGATGTVTTRVVSQDRTGPWARAGLVVRNDLTANGSAGFLNLSVTPDNGCVLSWDADGNGQLDSIDIASGFTAPAYLRVTRDGTGFTGACSTDGSHWTTVGTATVASAAPTEDVGLVDTAANGGSGAEGLARFDGFAITAN